MHFCMSYGWTMDEGLCSEVNVSTGIADDEVGTPSYTNGLKLFVMFIPSCVALLTNPLLFC
jgi:hypothetical protein